MNKVIVFAGTTEGREICSFLKKYEIASLACTATEYGKCRIEEGGALTVRSGRMTEEEMDEQLKQYFIEQYNSEDIETVTTEVTINMKKEDGKWNIDCDEDAFVDAVLPGYREVEESLNNMNQE